MNIVDFEAMEIFIVTDDMNAWDAEWGCVDAVQSVDAAHQPVTSTIWHEPCRSKRRVCILALGT